MTETNQEPAPQIEAEPAHEQVESTEPKESVFTQSELNSIVAREVAKAKRSVKKAQPTKQEPTASTGESFEAIAALTAQVEALTQMTTARAADEDFAAKVAGIEMDSDERASLRLAFSGNPELFARQVAKHKAKHEPPVVEGEAFAGIGAPNPIAAQDRETNPMEWTADTVARYRADGTFLKRIADYKATLPGGSGGLFKAKVHK